MSLKEVEPVEQAQAIKHIEMVWDSENDDFDDARSIRSARRPSSSREYTNTPFDYSRLSFNHPLVVATFGRYPDLMEPAIPSGRTR
jgi:hypothetical protein